MFLLRIAKRFPFLQNIAGQAISCISPLVEHNFGKYFALKKAFYLTALEKLDGDYLEFGVFTGGALVFSTKANRKMRWINRLETRFFGFDSFTGFGDLSDEDKHPFYNDETFHVDYNRVKKNVLRQTKGSEVQLIRGFFSETLDGRDPASYGIQKARIIFVDCDMMQPALSALKFSRDIIQEGTILILDDYFSYKGNPNLGVSGAFRAFREDFSELKWRRLFSYGYLGQAFICAGNLHQSCIEDL